MNETDKHNFSFVSQHRPKEFQRIFIAGIPKNPAGYQDSETCLLNAQWWIGLSRFTLFTTYLALRWTNSAQTFHIFVLMPPDCAIDQSSLMTTWITAQKLWPFIALRALRNRRKCHWWLEFLPEDCWNGKLKMFIPQDNNLTVQTLVQVFSFRSPNLHLAEKASLVLTKGLPVGTPDLLRSLYL